ncbi:MAG: bi-domain-containing oxidoreductase [Bdellovibrionales bacterium]|nr:bi-domain-containing oxidoreductase [Bdellovibrionales bacterium]
MKQLLNSLKDGRLTLSEVPAPGVQPGHLLIRTTCSLISAGTERMILDFGKAGLLEKAKQQPDKVRQVLEKIGSDGLPATMESVRSKLNQPIPLGYSNVGRVVAIGAGVEHFRVGDRVVSNGHHAELAHVPKHLCARIPDEVSDEAASFTVVSSIALHGIRLLQPTLGESVGVFGLGLIGLVAVQLLKANGLRVLGLDPNPDRLLLGKLLGADAVADPTSDDVAARGELFTDGIGVDAVLITASTRNDSILHQAAQMSRKRGRIVLTGVVDLNLRRTDFYEKELTFQVSCSYGPGRYDSGYELRGNDYPLPYVRWTEQRNFDAVLEQLRRETLRVEQLITNRFSFDRAGDAYSALDDPAAIGILLEYPEGATERLLTRTAQHHPSPPRLAEPRITAALIGSGNYGSRVLLPAMKHSGAVLRTVASAKGLSAAIAAEQHGAAQSSTDSAAVLSDPDINVVFIATRHDQHAPLVIDALTAGKHVYVEKPLCLTEEELEQVLEAANQPKAPLLMVGFNRRFAPLVEAMQTRLVNRTKPLALSVTCNAGQLPTDHWLNDPLVGGGRLLGEGCHFIDLLCFLVGVPVTSLTAQGDASAGDPAASQSVTVTLRFADNSIGAMNYFANGSKAYPKERLEVFAEGRTMVLDNFRSLRGWGYKPRLKQRLWSQDKGQTRSVAAFLTAVREGKPNPMPLADLEQSMRTTFAAVRALRERTVIALE